MGQKIDLSAVLVTRGSCLRVVCQESCQRNLQTQESKHRSRMIYLYCLLCTQGAMLNGELGEQYKFRFEYQPVDRNC